MRVFVIPVIIVSCLLSSCNITTKNEEMNDSKSSEQAVVEGEDVAIAQETDEVKAVVLESKIDPYVFEVNDLLEMRRDKSQISDYYITKTGYPLNLYYIDENKILWGCGYNECGQLGQGTQSEELNQEMVKIAENVVHVTYSQLGYTVYLTEDHKLYGMGTNATGALLEDIIAPLGVAYHNSTLFAITTPKLLMEDVSYVSLGHEDVVVMKTDNTVWTWGVHCISTMRNLDNYYDREPVLLLENAKLITGGSFNHAALLNDGTLWTWGYNFTGNCGSDGEYFILKPQKVANDVKMVWTGSLNYNIDTTDINELNKTYEGTLENTIIEKTDGSFLACGVNIGETEKTLDYYYEVGEPYTIICSSEFLPCVIREKETSE